MIFTWLGIFIRRSGVTGKKNYRYNGGSKNGTIFSGWWLSAHPQTYQPVGEHNPKPKRGWWLTYPSEKWWSESQLGWWNSQPNGKIIHMFQTTNQYIYITNQSNICWSMYVWASPWLHVWVPPAPQPLGKPNAPVGHCRAEGIWGNQWLFWPCSQMEVS